MFHDAQEELKRLEAELLAEEEPEEEMLPEEEEEDEEEAWLYEDTRAASEPEVFQNYSNDYGKNLRNYASGYRAYNSDLTDEDLEQYSEEVYESRRPKTGCLSILICLLTVAIAAALILWLAHERGLL